MQHERAIDMKQRYVGHCNVGTDIKQASFLGQKGNKFFHHLSYCKTWCEFIGMLLRIAP